MVYTFRPHMFTEAVHHLAVAFHEEDPTEREFNAGCGHGYLIAFGLEPRNALEAARRAPFITVQATPPTGPFIDEALTFSAGVLWGYKQATSELPNIEECATCGGRIVLDVDRYEECTDVHGDPAFFCEDGCHTLYHSPCPYLPACEQCDDNIGAEDRTCSHGVFHPDCFSDVHDGNFCASVDER